MQQTTELPAVVNQQKMRRTLLGKVPVISPLYQLHPVTRLFTLLFLGVVSLFILVPEINAILIVLILLYLIWAKVDISGLRVYLPLTLTVAIFMFVVSTAFPGPKPDYHVFKFLGITFYLEVFFFTFCSYFRLMAMLFGTIQYFSTNRERDTLVAIRTLKIPFVVTYFFSLALRSAGMFLEDMHTIREAERARGLDESTMSLKDRAKLYGMYMIPLFTVAIRRTDEISNALFARGYTPSGKVEGGGKRTDYILTQYPIRPIDIDIILDQDGNPVQRPADTAGLALPVERFGNPRGVRVEFDNGVQGRAMPVNLFDALEITFQEAQGSQFTRGQLFLQVQYAHFFHMRTSLCDEKSRLLGAIARRMAYQNAITGCWLSEPVRLLDIIAQILLQALACRNHIYNPPAPLILQKILVFFESKLIIKTAIFDGSKEVNMAVQRSALIQRELPKSLINLVLGILASISGLPALSSLFANFWDHSRNWL